MNKRVVGFFVFGFIGVIFVAGMWFDGMRTETQPKDSLGDCIVSLLSPNKASAAYCAPVCSKKWNDLQKVCEQHCGSSYNSHGKEAVFYCNAGCQYLVTSYNENCYRQFPPY